MYEKYISHKSVHSNKLIFNIRYLYGKMLKLRLLKYYYAKHRVLVFLSIKSDRCRILTKYHSSGHPFNPIYFQYTRDH